MFITELEALLCSAIEQSASQEAMPNEVILYGAGSIGRECLLLLQSKGVVVRAVLDAKSPLKQLEGVQVLRPDDASFTAKEKVDLQVVITIFNAYISMNDIMDLIKAAGWSKVTGFLEFHRKNSASLGDKYWLTDPSFYKIQSSAWRDGATIWEDADSAKLYLDILKFRFTADYADAPLPHTDEQYFPATIPAWPKNLRFVDCGAYDGDTIELLGRRGYQVDALAAFEPDAANLAILSRKLTTIAPVAQPAALWPCGVYSSTAQLKFNSGQGSGSAISDSGDSVIQCISLDDALTGFRPNLIKMDIEGAEYAALLGGRKLIEGCRPGLAICLYHHPAHLWQIPNLVRSWKLDYRFYLRVHSNNGFELVMYAVPNQ